jgi:hypothetical protein
MNIIFSAEERADKIGYINEAIAKGYEKMFHMPVSAMSDSQLRSEYGRAWTFFNIQTASYGSHSHNALPKDIGSLNWGDLVNGAAAEKARHDHACVNSFADQGPCLDECAIADEIGLISEHYFTAAQGDHQAKEDDLKINPTPYVEATPDPLHLVMFCMLVLQGGQVVFGQDIRSNFEDYDPDIAQKSARSKALKKAQQIKALMKSANFEDASNSADAKAKAEAIKAEAEAKKAKHKQLCDGFEDVAKPLIKWLAENVHPHHTAVITSNSAELLETKMCSRTDEFLKD